MTTAMISAILSLLLAFGVDITTVNKVYDILSPVATTTAPILLGSIGSVATTSPPVVQPSIPSDWDIRVITEGYDGKPITVARAGVDMLKFRVEVYDKNGVYHKMPVTVTTNYPDLPSSFVTNYGDNFFCVASEAPSFGQYVHPNEGGGCPIQTPSSNWIGTFDFTFTVEDVSVTKQVTVMP